MIKVCSSGAAIAGAVNCLRVYCSECADISAPLLAWSDVVIFGPIELGLTEEWGASTNWIALITAMKLPNSTRSINCRCRGVPIRKSVQVHFSRHNHKPGPTSKLPKHPKRGYSATISGRLGHMRFALAVALATSPVVISRSSRLLLLTPTYFGCRAK